MAAGETFKSSNLVPGMALGQDPTNVMLTADNQYVQVAYGRVGFLRLSSNDTTAASRTFTLSNGAVDGQVMCVHFVSAASTTAQLADSGNVKLSAAWEPTVDDTLTLMWDKLSAVWREVARVDN